MYTGCPFLPASKPKPPILSSTLDPFPMMTSCPGFGCWTDHLSWCAWGWILICLRGHFFPPIDISSLCTRNLLHNQFNQRCKFQGSEDCAGPKFAFEQVLQVSFLGRSTISVGWCDRSSIQPPLHLLMLLMNEPSKKKHFWIKGACKLACFPHPMGERPQPGKGKRGPKTNAARLYIFSSTFIYSTSAESQVL